MAEDNGLRVLVVTIVHDPEDARIRRRQIGALLEAGARVTLAAPYRAYGREGRDGVRALDLPRARHRRRLGAVRAARELIRREAPAHDVVLLHDPELLVAVAGLRITRSARGGGPGPVLVWDVHEDTAAALGLKSWLPAPLRPVVAAVVRRLERWAEGHVLLTLAETSYQARFRLPHPVVPNTVPMPAAEPAAPGTDRVVYIGRVTRQRGGLDMLELGRLLAGRVAVELIGPVDGDISAVVRQAEREGAVRCHGFVPNQQALALLDGALAGLSLLHDEPNYAQSRPTKVMEYMAHGLPVVTTPNASSVDLVERFGCGVVVPFEDPAAAAAALEALRQDAPRRCRLGAAGRVAAVEHLDWRTSGEQFVALLAGWAGLPAPGGARRGSAADGRSTGSGRA
jgi:glycosyltransferase involved in cell wall biosynthesis